MTDACTVTIKVSTSTRGASFIEGVSKSSYVKHASDIKGSSVKVLNCHESAIYILAPLRYATVYGCSDATTVLGAVGKLLKVKSEVLTESAGVIGQIIVKIHAKTLCIGFYILYCFILV